jgi:parvulin-like peptidyl-prolyl isomerase
LKTLRTAIVVLLCLSVTLVVSAQTTGRTGKTGTTRPTTTAAAAKPAKPAATRTAGTLATVNGSAILHAHVNNAISQRWAAAIIRSLIDSRLILLEARRVAIKVSPEEYQRAYNEVRAAFPTEAAFQRHLHLLGLTAQAFADNLNHSLLLDKLIRRECAVTDDEALRYYDGHKEAYTTPGKVHLLAIVTGTVEDAYLARERLAAGDKFEAVAKDLSIHQSKENGGDMGWLQPGDLPDPALNDAIFALDPGAVSSPLRSGNTYYVAQVKERKPGQVVTFAEARAKIVERLAEDKILSQEEYLRMLARKANIVVGWAPVTYLTEEYRRLHDIRVIVDGRTLELETLPYRLTDGTIMVPAKPLFQALGARLDLVAGKTLTASTPAGKVKLIIGSASALVGEEGKQVMDMKQAPVSRAGTLFIAPRIPLQALGAKMVWSVARNAVIVTTAIKPTTPAALDKQP